MATLQCPNCGARVDSPEGWAKAALSTLMPSPAIPDMATQLRCPRCHTLFTQRQGGRLGTWRGWIPVAELVLALLAVVLFLATS